MSSDFTTDAMPSAPIQENDNRTSQKQEESFNQNPTTESTYKTKKTGRSSKAHIKTPQYSTIHNVNISNAGSIHIGPVNNNYYPGTEVKKKPRKQHIEQTKNITKLFESDIPVSTNDILIVCKYLDGDWRFPIRVLLGPDSDSRIDQYYEQHIVRGVDEVIYQLLLDWIQDQSKSATVGRLSKVFWKNDQKFAVQKWAEQCF